MVAVSLPSTFMELAQRIGCTRYPQRWNTLYDDCLTEFQKNGCPYTDPAYYSQLNEQFGILSDDLPLYQEAATAVGKDQDLSLFLAVLCRALQDREHHKQDLAEFSMPYRDNLANQMLCGLAAASEAPMCHRILSQRSLPKDIVDNVMKMPEWGVQFYRLRHKGANGYSLLDWYQLAIDGHLFSLGRLTFEIFVNFTGRACVFENKNGERIALAHNIPLHSDGVALGSAGYHDATGSFTPMIEEFEDHWIGCPIHIDGTVSRNSIILQKDQWKKILSHGDSVVSIHIPTGSSLAPDAVESSIAAARAFLSEYFPDYDYRAFVCHSWLMDPQLIQLLGSDSNIAKFNSRFDKLPRRSEGKDVFSFVFLKPDNNFDLRTLPERTTLERKLKDHYLAGKYIYELIGYFF